MSSECHPLSGQGARRMTFPMLAARDRADQFQGAPHGTARPLRFLAAFQEAEPYLGLPPQAFKLIAWLVKMTVPLDWEEGSRPIAWPSAERQAEFLALSPARVKTLNRALFEAGIFVLRDSPTGKRYGRRDGEGRILEAYGFDLSPLAYRYDEFVQIAAEARAERERIGRLRRRATCARRAIAQIGETLAGADSLPQDWPLLLADTAALVAAIRRARNSADLAVVVEGLERLKTQAEEWVKEVAAPVNNSPAGPADEPHIISTKETLNPKDTVVAPDKGSGGEAAPSSSTSTIERNETVTLQTFERVESIRPAELLQLAPRLADHVRQTAPDWTDIVDAAGGGLRHELGVSHTLWGEACVVVGRQIAAVTLAVVSTKPAEYFTRGAGGYFAAMIKRAKMGELHLDRSLWKLRRNRLDRIESEFAGPAG